MYLQRDVSHGEYNLGRARSEIKITEHWNTLMRCRFNRASLGNSMNLIFCSWFSHVSHPLASTHWFSSSRLHTQKTASSIFLVVFSFSSVKWRQSKYRLWPSVVFHSFIPSISPQSWFSFLFVNDSSQSWHLTRSCDVCFCSFQSLPFPVNPSRTAVNWAQSCHIYYWEETSNIHNNLVVSSAMRLLVIGTD